MKRVIDATFALAALFALSPLLVVVGVWIKLADRGPVFYGGARVGRGGRLFRMLKFRTMVTNADQIGPSSTGDDDPRITRPGRFMRRFKVDELPQLINVLRGEMSFVGPRPQVQWAVELYTAEERALLSVRPGITDYASLRYRNEGEILRGFPDADQAYLKLIAPGKIRLGLHYVRTYSLVTDVILIVATALAVAGVDPKWCQPTLEPPLAPINPT